ncbi:hypothetical protein [Streptomyces sp. 3213.3]|uniref:hypothetical protein n=1 Tax=Streptomyces sp. 3213.3 TaxID=1855348 RepID=UPI0010420BC3|nr:hypothetical protein [Streptomyces sp. 3213.3]
MNPAKPLEWLAGFQRASVRPRRPRARRRLHFQGAHSSHVTLETADIALTGNDLRDVAVVELSRHALRVVRQNHTLAIGVNSRASPQVPAAPFNPVLAVLLDNLSGIAADSARLVRHL